MKNGTRVSLAAFDFTNVYAKPEPAATPMPTPTPTLAPGRSTTTTTTVTTVTARPTTTPTVDLTGHKLWVDDGNKYDTRPAGVTVRLYANGALLDAEPVWLDTEGDNWTFTFENLPVVDGSGASIAYTVDELPVAGYEATVSGLTITNRLILREPKAYTTIQGEKTWRDDDNAGNTRPSFITIRLLQNGEAIAQRTVTAASEWRYAFEDIPVDDGYGHTYAYEVREDAVDGYFTRVNGYNVTNILLPKESLVPTGNGPRDTVTPEPEFTKYSQAELEELLQLFGYDTPLWGGLLRTGDETPTYPYVFAGTGLLALMLLLVLSRRRRNGAAARR